MRAKLQTGEQKKLGSKDLFDFKNTIKILKILWDCSKWHTLYKGISTIIMGILPLIPLYLLKLLLDHFAEGTEPDRQYLLMILIAFASISIISLILKNLNTYVGLLQGDIINDHMAGIINSKVIDVDLAYFDSHDYHDYFQRAVGRGGMLPTITLNAVTSVMQNFVTLGAIGGILISLHWGIAVMLILIALPVAYIRYIYSAKTVELRERQTPTEREANYFKRMITAVDFAKEVRVFDYGKRILERYLGLRKQIRRENIDLYKRKTTAVTLSQAAESIAIISAIGFIVFRAVAGYLTVGDIALYYTTFKKGQTSVNNALKSVVQLQENKLYLNHLFDFLALVPKIKDPKMPLPFPEKIEEIRVENVSFVYPETKKQVLKNISLTLEKGKMYAIVGENGSGKTTLVKLLNRLYDPNDGQILINDKTIKRYKLGSLRKKITVIFQYFAKYYVSIRENVTIAEKKGEEDMDRLRDALKYSQADTFVDAMPNGIDTRLGRSFKDGEELSGGQWQKVALARAFYKKADLIILDEPTAFIDPLSEDFIFNNMRKYTKDNILLLITHRMYNLQQADQIIVMDKGEIVEMGPHSYLMQLNGLYCSMFEKQEVE